MTEPQRNRVPRFLPTSKLRSRSCALPGVVPRCIRDSADAFKSCTQRKQCAVHYGMKLRSRPERKRPSSSSECNTE